VEVFTTATHVVEGCNSRMDVAASLTGQLQMPAYNGARPAALRQQFQQHHKQQQYRHLLPAAACSCKQPALAAPSIPQLPVRAPYIQQLPQTFKRQRRHVVCQQQKNKAMAAAAQPNPAGGEAMGE
jgi:hypothetical protein